MHSCYYHDIEKKNFYKIIYCIIPRILCIPGKQEGKEHTAGKYKQVGIDPVEPKTYSLEIPRIKENAY